MATLIAKYPPETLDNIVSRTLDNIVSSLSLITY